MPYVILRDDDANGTTPPALLEPLYRPFLDRGWPVCLAVIPEVRTDARTAGGEPEVFVRGPRRGTPGTAPLADNGALLAYLRAEALYSVAQHGLHHARVGGRFEFDRDDGEDLAARLERGTRTLLHAGIARPRTFVAPQDQISRAGVREVMARFPVLSTGYMDLGRVPRRHWPRYLAMKKLARRAHYRLGACTLLTHPGCLLSRGREPGAIVEAFRGLVRSQPLTVVVSHHAEYFDGDALAPGMVDALHALPALFEREGVRVIGFEEAMGLV